MKIIGHGVDIVEIAHIDHMVDDAMALFVSRSFTSQELEDAGTGANRSERLAGRFAAKEAVAKAMGAAAGDGFAWVDIEIVTADTGEPHVVLKAGAAGLAASLGISGWFISTSHDGAYAIASVIAIG